MILSLDWEPGYAEAIDRLGIDVVNVVDRAGYATALSDGRPADRLVTASRPSDAGTVLTALARRGLAGPFRAVHTSDEAAVITAAVLAEHFGTAGLGVEVAIACRDKLVQKRTVAAAGLPVTRFTELDPGDVPGSAASVRFPAVVKPADASGSRDTAVVRDAEELDRVIRWKDHVGSWMLEEFVDGQEVHVDGVVAGGDLRFISVGMYTAHVLSVSEQVPLATRTLPRGEFPELWAASEYLARRASHAFGVRDSVFHLEAFWRGSELVFSEYAARAGGGFIVPILRHQLGLDLYQTSFELAAGLPPREPRQAAGSTGFALIPRPCPGIVTMTPDAAVLKGMPGVLDVGVAVRPGDRISAPGTRWADQVGFVVVHADSVAEVDDDLTRVVDAFTSGLKVLRA